MSNVVILILVGAAMFAILGGVTLLNHYYNLNNIKSKTVGDGQHGTARWATKKEIKQTYKHIPFTPKRWREQAKSGIIPTVAHAVKRKKKKGKAVEEQTLPQGIIVGCEGNTTALVDTGDVHVLMIGAAGVGLPALQDLFLRHLFTEGYGYRRHMPVAGGNTDTLCADDRGFGIYNNLAIPLVLRMYGNDLLVR